MFLSWEKILTFLVFLKEDCRRGFTLSFAIISLVGVTVFVAYMTYVPNICKGSGINFTEDLLLPYEEDCTKFYKCDNGELVLLNCPEELEWDDEHKICDWPSNAGCSNTIKPCDIAGEPVCPEHDPSKPAVHLPNPKDCGSFYTCDWGVAHLTHCPATLHFNAELQVCDYPEKANCVCPPASVVSSDDKKTDVLNFHITHNIKILKLYKQLK